MNEKKILYIITDSSTNGTFADGERLEKGGSAAFDVGGRADLCKGRDEDQTGITQ